MKRFILALVLIMIMFVSPSCGKQQNSDSSVDNPETVDDENQNVYDFDDDSQSDWEGQDGYFDEDDTDDDAPQPEYLITKFADFSIEPSGEFWVYAFEIFEGRSNNGVYLAMNADLDELFVIDAEAYSPISGIYNGITLLRDEQRKESLILDKNGDDVTAQYIDVENGEEALLIAEDETGVTIWTVQEIDTYDKHTTVLTAKSLDGKVKQSWSSDTIDLSHVRDGLYYRYPSDSLDYIGNNIYTFHQTVLNVSTGNVFEFPTSGNYYDICGADEDGFVYAKHNSGVGIDLIKYSDSGEVVWKLTFRSLKGVEAKVGEYSEGYIYVCGKDDRDNTFHRGFVNQDGTLEIALTFNVDDSPVFIGDKALVSIVNSGNVNFFTLIDKSGNMVFEPVKGKAIYSEDSYAAQIGEKYVLLDAKGNQTEIPWEFNEYIWRRVNDRYLVIVDGGILEYNL